MKGLLKKDFKKIIPGISTCFFWFLAYFLANHMSVAFHKTEPVPNFIFLIPILIQFFFLLLFLLKFTQTNRYEATYYIWFHLSYGSFMTQFWFPESWNGVGFLFGAVVGLSLSLTLQRERSYLLTLFFFYGIGLLTFYFKGRVIGTDEMVSIPIHIGICIFYPLINYYLCFLKNSLRKKRKIADSLMERQSYFLENLGQGFMVIDHKGLIQEGATHVTKEIFGENPEGKHFGDLLRLTKEKREVLNKWLHNIWRGVLSFKDLIPLAPQFFQNNEGRFIELHYKPIYVYGSRAKIDKFICVAIDKTHEISLKKQLERDKQNAYFIKACLQNPMDFIDLLRDSYELLETYPIIFEMDEKEIFRKFHTLKARYGQFGIKDLSSLINDVESVISRGDINDLIMKVDAFEKELKSFVKKNGLIIESAKKSSVEEGGGIDVKEIIKIGEEFNLSDHYLKHIRENYLLSDLKRKFIRYGHLVDELGEKQGKVIDLKIKGDKIRVDTHKYSNFIHTSIHLFRNMVDHGIEPEDERIEKNKPPRGNIEVDFKKQDDSFLITLKDNGRGIDPNKIKQKVLDIKLKSEKELENLKGPELINLIFLPGLSTMEKITEISGRGVGMDAVREEIERLGGEIKVTSVLDEGTTFFIKLPFLG